MRLNFLNFYAKKKTAKIVEEPVKIPEQTAHPQQMAHPLMHYPIFLNSLPKSGTHLLSKAVMGIPNIAHSGYHLDRKTIAQFVDEGVDYPFEGRDDMHIPRDFPWIEKLLQAVQPGQYITSHMLYNPPMYNLLKNMNFKIILMMRDPRDVVVSWADFMKKEETHLLFPFLSQKDLDFRITIGIRGATKEITGIIRQPSISELIIGHFEWVTQPGPFLVKVEDLGHFEWVTRAGTFLVKFEDLIGEKGEETKRIKELY